MSVIKTFKSVSLFSGGGGLDLGFESAGFKSILCTDIEQIACETLKANGIGKIIINKPIEKISNEELKNIHGISDLDVVIGGPPCPAFSKSRFYRKEMTHGTDDPSFSTVIDYFRVIEALCPKFFVFENVHTFAAKRQKGALDYVLNKAKEIGYETNWKVLNALNYGVPQKRQRFILVGHLPGYIFHFPEITNRDPKSNDMFEAHLPKWKTAGEAISDLYKKENGPDLPGHFAGGKDHNLLKKIPPGDNYLFFTKKRGHPIPVFKWRSRYWSFLLKLSPEQPSWTIQARRSNNMGPFHWRNRILTIPEVKRLQSFPDDFNFSGTIEQQWRQIGNAVPPLLANCIAKQIAESINRREEVGIKAA